MRRPWNQDATGVLAVNTYDEFLKLVEVISESYSVKRKKLSLSSPSVVVFVGPSGSGKNDIAEELLNQIDSFEKLVSYTTDKTALDKKDGWYHYISEEKFREMSDNGEFFETTTYARYSFGSRIKDVEDILSEGKHVLTVMDICGAMALKTVFQNVVTVYVKRDQKDLLAAILEKQCPNEDKVNRLLAIPSEIRNCSVCDYTVRFENRDQAVKELRDGLGC
jgi:guanylate kinase